MEARRREAGKGGTKPSFIYMQSEISFLFYYPFTCGGGCSEQPVLYQPFLFQSGTSILKILSLYLNFHAIIDEGG